MLKCVRYSSRQCGSKREQRSSTNDGVFAGPDAEGAYDSTHALLLLLVAHRARQPQHGRIVEHLPHRQALVQEVILRACASTCTGVSNKSCGALQCYAGHGYVQRIHIARVYIINLLAHARESTTHQDMHCNAKLDMRWRATHPSAYIPQQCLLYSLNGNRGTLWHTRPTQAIEDSCPTKEDSESDISRRDRPILRLLLRIYEQ